jgi:hypothetical protein
MRLTLAVALSIATLFADQVTVKNGDRVTGTIVKKDADKLTFNSDVFGEVTIPWNQVVAITTDKPVHVVLSDGRTIEGTVTSRDDTVEIGGERISRTEVTAMRDAAEQLAYERLLSPGWGDLWTAAASLGFAGTQGNARTRTLTTGLNAARVTNNDKTTLYFSAIRASALILGLSETTAQAVRGGWAYSRNVNTRLFVNAFNDYDYDRFQDLDLRFVLGGGLGYIAWKGERGRLDILGGAAYNRESFSPPAPDPEFTRNSGELYTGNDFTYKLNSVTALYQNLRFFPNLSETGEYRFNFDLGANTRLARWLTWNLALSNRLLSNPVPGRQKNDLLYSTGIGVVFGR